MAVLHWPPDTAWQATPHDILSAHAAWLKAQGIAPDAACTTDQLNSMMTGFPDE
jgi:Phage tail assembly chaperone protein, TAC